MLPSLTPLIPDFKKYIEPFCGSCALFFSLRPPSAVLGDINPLLIRTLTAVRDDPDAVFNTLKNLNWSKRAYYRLRPSALNEEDDLKLAANFIYLNANCFNGIFRLNKAGQFNVPYGGERAGRCPSSEKLQTASTAFHDVKFSCEDFDRTVRQHCRSGDFVYLDPPFALRNRRIFYQYRYDDFGTEDVNRLRSLMSWIDQQGSAFIVSYAASPEAETLAKGWRKHSAWRLGNIAGFKAARSTSSEEILITNV